MSDFTDKVATMIERWKTILIGLAAVVVIALQIINMILTGGGHEAIQNLIGYKTDAINQKTDALTGIASRNRTDIYDIKHELDEIEKKLNGP